jgi:hypothetical protein
MESIQPSPTDQATLKDSTQIKEKTREEKKKRKKESNNTNRGRRETGKGRRKHRCLVSFSVNKTHSEQHPRACVCLRIILVRQGIQKFWSTTVQVAGVDEDCPEAPVPTLYFAPENSRQSCPPPVG